MSDELQAGETLLRLLEGRRRARDLVFERADLRGIQLSGLRPDGLDLEDSDLGDTNLSMVRWHACVVRDAHLDRTDLQQRGSTSVRL